MSGSFDEDLERCKQRVGTVVRGYRLEALLGVGGMAAVYAASHAGGKVAIKILHAHVAVSKELRARFEQEALAVGKLGHPASVQVYAVSMTDEGAPFMVMELLEGESLGQRAHRLDVPALELLGHVETLLDVLAVAHDKGIIHRDIKPDNLFVQSDGRLKVLDFGIARMREGGRGVHTRTGAMLGTTAYMAPEQIHARPLDGRADLFSVGATMFRVLAKRKLFEAESDASLLMLMGSTQAPAIASVAPDLDPRVAKIVDRALAFDRDERYPDARAMQEDVRRVLRGEEPVAAASLAAAPAAAPPSRGFPLPSEPTAAPAPRATSSAAPRVSPELPPERRAPVALVAILGLLMVGAGSGLAYWLLAGSKEAESAPARPPSGEEERASASPTTGPSAAPTAKASGAPTARRPTGTSRPPSSATVGVSALPTALPTVATPITRPTGSGKPPLGVEDLLPNGKEKKDKEKPR